MPYLPPPQFETSIVDAQLEIDQGATFRRTIACDLSYYGINDIGAWATSASFTLSFGLRGDEFFRAVAAGSVFIAGNNVTLDLDESITDAITHRVGVFVVEVTDGTDRWRVIQGSWTLKRSTDDDQHSAELAAQPAFALYPLVRSCGPLGVLPYVDLPGRTHVLAQGFGLWKVQSNTGAPTTSPELLDALYRTRVNITFSGSGGVPPVANQIVEHSLGWRARVVSVGGGTAVLSLYNGTALDGGANELFVSGFPGDKWTGVSVGTFSGAITGYQATVTEGVFAPRAPAPAGIYNCIGSKQNTANGSLFPLAPENYDLTFVIPPERFAEGAVLEVLIAGVLKNDIPAGDNPRLHATLAIGSSIFREAELDVERPNWMRFESPVLPTIAAESPFFGTFRVQTSRKSDFTQGQIAMFLGEMDSAVYGGAGAWRTLRQRGSDKLVLPADFPGFELEDGDDPVNKRCARNVGVWLAVSPEFNTGLPGVEFYVKIHAYLVRLTHAKR
jgi:hypothetical protein